jgi:hypothetical protein
VNTKSSLESYQDIKHSFQVWEENGVFTLFIPEYGIFTKNEDLSEGYKELASEKEKYFLRLSEAGISSVKLYDLSSSGNSFLFQKADARLKDFGQLVLKTIIIVALTLGIGSVSLVVAGNVLGKNMGRVFAKIERYQPLEKAVAKIESLSDEEIEEFGRQFRRVSKKLQPLVSELKIIWRSKQLQDSTVVHSVESEKLEE